MLRCIFTKKSFTDKHVAIQEIFKKKFTDLEKENTLCRKTNEDLVKDSKNKEDEIERLKKLLASKDKELTDQRAENAALKSQLISASGELSGNENELRTLHEHVAAIVQSSHTDHVQLCCEISAFI